MQPVVISSGTVAWQFLQKTYDRQLETFAKAPELSRDIDYFAENIGNVVTAEQLVSDRQLLNVALGAFGLQDDLNNRFFIQKMLEEGTTADDALANRFTDTRYREFSAAFSFGPNEIPRTLFSDFADTIIEKFKANAFEVAVGDQDDTMRIALYAERILSETVSGDGSKAQKWFSIMGQAPLRQLFETVFSLPAQFAQIDIDQQLQEFENRSEREFGSDDPNIFADPEVMQELIQKFVARSQIAQGSTFSSSAATALVLLQG